MRPLKYKAYLKDYNKIVDVDITDKYEVGDETIPF